MTLLANVAQVLDQESHNVNSSVGLNGLNQLGTHHTSHNPFQRGEKRSSSVALACSLRCLLLRLLLKSIQLPSSQRRFGCVGVHTLAAVASDLEVMKPSYGSGVQSVV